MAQQCAPVMTSDASVSEVPEHPPTSLAQRFRRSRLLGIRWAGNRFGLVLATTDIYVEVDVTTLELLSALDDWCTLEEVLANFPDHEPDSVRASLDQLIKLGLVVDSEDRPREYAATAWASWGPEALLFHHATTDAPFLSPEQELAQVAPALAREVPPAAFKRYPMARRLFLPRAFLETDALYRQVRVARRTCRSFAAQAVPLLQLSTLLHYAFAPLHFVDARHCGVITMRAHASGGGRHEQECYLGVACVEGVPSGLYHYNALEHSLEQLRTGFNPEYASRLCCGQSWVASAPVVVFVTGVFARMMWKYRHPRAYRVMHMNMGSLMQSFSTSAHALGLAPFVTAALRDSEIDRYLGVDGIEESVLTVMATGLPGETATALPWPSRPAGLVGRELMFDAPLPPPEDFT